MENFIFMNMLKPQADFDKKFPNFLFFEIFFILLFEISAKIATLAELHEYIEIIIFYKRIIIAYNIRMLELTHNMSLISCLYMLFLTFFLAFSLIRVKAICFKTHTDLSVLFSTLYITP